MRREFERREVREMLRRFGGEREKERGGERRGGRGQGARRLHFGSVSFVSPWPVIFQTKELFPFPRISFLD